jgi:site-specific DNA recombinase
MTAPTTRRRRVTRADHVLDVATLTGEYAVEIRNLVGALRERDANPDCDEWPRLDAYVRISINRETGATEKTDRQVRDVLRVMTERKCRLGQLLRDDNLSAWQKNATRPGWDAAVSRVTSAEVQGVFVVHIDRYLRQPRQLEQLIDAADKGSLVWSLYGEFDLGTSMGRFIARQMVSQAAMQSDETSRRGKSKTAARREAGIRHGGTRPFGQPGREYDGEAYVPADPEIVRKERDAVVWAIEALIGGTTLADIAREWNARGLVTRGAEQPFRYKTVRAIMERPDVAGFLIHEGNIVGRLRNIEPIVSEDRWRLMLSMLRSRPVGRPSGSNAYPLSSSVLVCGECGGMIAGKFDRCRRYACGRRPECGRVTVNAERTEAVVKERVLAVLTAPGRPDMVARRTRRLADARDRLRAAEGALNGLAARFAAGTMTLDEWDIVRPPMAAAADNARHNVEVLELGDGAYELTTSETLDDLVERWESGEAAQMTRAAFASITVSRATHKHQHPAERLAFVERT